MKMESEQFREGHMSEEDEEGEGKHMVFGDNKAKYPFHISTTSSSSSCPSTSSYYKDIFRNPQIPPRGAPIEDNYQLCQPGTFDTKENAGTAYDQVPPKFHGSESTADSNPIEKMDLSSSTNSTMDAAAEGDESGRNRREREHMFEKVVTPSDVGKLNRLVIPKQHAEKYFPLDLAANEKGLLLNFEDRNGRPWRFRYSYWNSSQSYVMTKGWSRFVKEKKLDAGDIVSFERGIGESGKDRLYIDWKHRTTAAVASSVPLPHPLSLHRPFPWGGLLMPPSISMSTPHAPHLHLQHLNFSHDHSNYSPISTYGYNAVNTDTHLFHMRSIAPQQVGVGRLPLPQGGDANMAASPMVMNSFPPIRNRVAGKRLRLFGVNLDCSTSAVEGKDDETSLPLATASTPQGIPMPSSHSTQFSPPLQIRVFNSTSPVGTEPPELSTKEKQHLSLDLDF